MWPSLSCPVAGYPSPLLRWMPPLTEGLHPPSDPWGSARSMVQPGYSAMLGNSPHLSQHAPFTAINPQDRLVSCSCCSLVLFFYEDIMRSLTLMHHWGLLSVCAFKSFCVFASQKRQPLPLSPQNYPMHGSEVNGAHPAGFHSGPGSFGVPSHTPPMADTIMGKAFNVCSL